MIYAHSLEDRPESDWETLEAHSLRVGTAAAARAQAAGFEDLARLLGHLHDIGKVKPEFQGRLRGATKPVSHSGEGARLLAERGQSLGRMLSATIAGHHGRLPNSDTLYRRLAEAEAIPPPPWADFDMPPPQHG